MPGSNETNYDKTLMQPLRCRWEFKAKNFDSVMLFKMGKFYEMFEMDAYVGADILGLTFMKVHKQPTPQF